MAFLYKKAKNIKAPFTVTYVLGACAIYDVRAVLEAWHGAERLFFDWAFAYFDDRVLALQLWNADWKCRAYPIIAGKHFKSRSFGLFNPFKIYLNLRNLIILGEITNSRFKKLIPLLAVRDMISVLEKISQHIKISKLLNLFIKLFLMPIKFLENSLKKGIY